jgi:glycine cleavage system H protein
MSAIPEDLLYTKDHEWVRLQDGAAVIGITDHAQKALGDIVFVDLPSVGQAVVQGKPLGSIESVKAASDLFSPLSGKVTAVNEALADAPDTVNRAPYGDGWLVKLQPSAAEKEKADLLDAAAYGPVAGD